MNRQYCTIFHSIQNPSSIKRNPLSIMEGIVINKIGFKIILVDRIFFIIIIMAFRDLKNILALFNIIKDDDKYKIC